MGIKKLIVQGQEISLFFHEKGEYICITDMARGHEGEPGDHIRNWLRNGSTIEFLGTWEKVHNPDFNLAEFHQIKSEFTRNTFLMSVTKWLARMEFAPRPKAENPEPNRSRANGDFDKIGFHEAAPRQNLKQKPSQ